VPFSAERLPVAPFDRVTEPSSGKILRESRSELLKPPSFIAEFCRRNIEQAECRASSLLERYAEAQPMFMKINKKKGLNMKVITMESASPDRLLTTREAAHLLNVSTRTLQRMRSEQRIGYVVLRGKCRYRQSEIDRLLDECTVNEDAATPQELKRNHTLRTGGTPKGRRT